jgi:hypothetical protein
MTPPYFRTALRLEKIGPHDWRLLEPLIFESRLLRGALVMPAGAETDLASTPRFVWALLPKSGAWDYACALHDGGYRGTLQTADGQRVRLIRRLADDVMREAMEATAVPAWARRLMYRAVRWFGGSAYQGVPT